MRAPSRRNLLLLLSLMSMSLAGCAGYRWGTRSLYRQDVRTVHVPVIESDSLRRALGERLTEAVIKQIELNSAYKVVGSPEEADSILRCQIVSDQKRILAETRTDEMRATGIAMQVKVDWLDRRNQSLIQRTEMPLPSNLLTITQSKAMVAETGQSIVSTQQAVIDAIAHQIVEQMEAAW